MKKKKILYIINVPWGWIKQRPHFLAKNLSEFYDVTVFERTYYNSFFKKNKQLVKNIKIETESFRINEYRTWSFEKIPWLKMLRLDDIINKFLIKYIYRSIIEEYDIVWFGSPFLYHLFGDYLSASQTIIYDCMDDHLAFPSIKKNYVLKNIINNAEKKLIRNADLVIFSSDYLRNQVHKRHGISIKSIVINNAIEMPNNAGLKKSLVADKIKSLSYPIVYIGTIAEWFDYEMMINLLNSQKDLNLILVGPLSSSKVNHPQIHYLGPVVHSEIFNIMKVAYALIMPFKINELILSVNPVKLYEYIYSGKPVISVRYNETEKFEDFVYLYNDFEELDKILKIIKDKSNDEVYMQKCLSFVAKNTWEERANQIRKELLQLDGDVVV